MKRKMLATAASLLGILLVGVAIVFAIGVPQAPAVRSQGAAVAQSSNSSGRFAIQIPGCVCHSDDPAIVSEHVGYRMYQCFGCH